MALILRRSATAAPAAASSSRSSLATLATTCLPLTEDQGAASRPPPSTVVRNGVEDATALWRRQFLRDNCRRWSSSVATASSPPEGTEGVENGAAIVDILPDFFGEPITFLGIPAGGGDDGRTRAPPSLSPSAAVQSLDEYLLCVVTRGSSSYMGGDALGVEIRASHSSAITWAGLIRRAAVLPDAPMVGCAAVAPLLAQGGGRSYVARVDGRLKEAGDKYPSLVRLAERAATMRDRPLLSPRERAHLRALRRLLDDDLPAAASEYLSLLRLAPGDLLALSLLLDISTVMGDASPAFAGAGCAASYWSDRPTSPGASLASSLVAAGFASGHGGGRGREAEMLADTAVRRDGDGAGGLGAYALALCYESEGRSSEGQSLLCGYDGVRKYEGCGFLNWDSRLGGMGAAFAMDRDGAGADRVAQRMYDNGYGRIISYGDAGRGMDRRAPGKMEGVMKQTGGFLKSLLGGDGEKWREEQEKVAMVEDGEMIPEELPPAIMEDVLTFLPPSTQFLAEGTMLLLRLTLCEAIEASDGRWNNLREAWQEAVAASGGWTNLHRPARVASALLLGQDALVFCDGAEPDTDAVSDKLIKAGCLLGGLLHLGRKDSNITESESNERETCSHIVRLLTETRDGVSFSAEVAGNESIGKSMNTARPALEDIRLLRRDLSGFDHLLRPLTEHALVRCALRSSDPADLAAARASCSEAVALRSNCPEVWWRYAEVLDALGDDVAAEGARSASVSLGSGEGGHFREKR